MGTGQWLLRSHRWLQESGYILCLTENSVAQDVWHILEFVLGAGTEPLSWAGVSECGAKKKEKRGKKERREGQQESVRMKRG